ncbi:MAG: hypothetical protein GY747_11075 [Planctomycetes bacterium]|nr:hypothetical protein [Planctomycetota bacterium]MCP4772172.1 hypothetical protein [Planctomycetota bacterium]MCP4861367.1 hypothetical protein [Planctomycetota bacterium]
MLTKKTSAVTDFRNGDTNLHFVHVNSCKSRSCNICHDPHATESSHMIRSSYAFDPSHWDLAIGWKDSVNGGRCAAGCHTAFEYDRLDPVTYPQGPGDEQDWRGRMPEESLQLPEGENQ